MIAGGNRWRLYLTDCKVMSAAYGLPLRWS
jgi:hypothetical protein